VIERRDNCRTRDRASAGKSPPVSRTLAVCLGILVCVAACVDRGITDAVVVTNQTSETVHFQLVAVDGRNFDLVANAAPGQSARVLDGCQLSDDAGLMRDRCTVGELRAIGPDSQIVSRFRLPVCAPSTLIIDASTDPS
jgi:hypothetical protein